jgi:hypothetical protein
LKDWVFLARVCPAKSYLSAVYLLQCLLHTIFIFQVADFGLAHASKDGSICFEPVETDIRGTPGPGIQYLCSTVNIC